MAGGSVSTVVQSLSGVENIGTEKLLLFI